MPSWWDTYGVTPQVGATGTFSKDVAQELVTDDAYWSDYFRKVLGESDLSAPAFNSTTNTEQSRLQQQRVIQELQAQAAGDLNSQAQQQLQQGYQSAQGQQSSLGSTMRGQSAGAARQSISAGQQGIQRGYAGDQQMLQLQEQQAAQALMAQLLEQQRSQDVSQAGSMAEGAVRGAGILDKYDLEQLLGAIGYEGGRRSSALDETKIALGYDLDRQAREAELSNRLINAGASATATAGSAYSNSRGVDNTPVSDPNEWDNPFPYRG